MKFPDGRAAIGRRRSRQRRIVSHLNWGSDLGFDAAGHYAIETVAGRRLAFDVTTGGLVAAR